MSVPKTTAAQLDKWLGAARAASSTRVELLGPKGHVLATLPLDDDKTNVDGQRLLEVASDDAAAMFGRVAYRARIYDGESFREEKRIVVDGQAQSADEAEEHASALPAKGPGDAFGRLCSLVEAQTREMRTMFKGATDALVASRQVENDARAKWGDMLKTTLDLAQMTLERETARAEVDRKRERDRLFAEHFGPGARALLGYLTTGKAVPVNDAVRKLFTSLMRDEDRAAKVMGLLTDAEKADLIAVGQFFDAEKTANGAAGAHASPESEADHGNS